MPLLNTPVAKFYYRTLAPFSDLFDLFLDVTCDPSFYGRRLREGGSIPNIETGLDCLQGLCLILKSRVGSSEYEVLQEGGRNYLKRISADPLDDIPFPGLNQWPRELHWTQLLFGLDSPIPKEPTKKKFRRIKLCDSSGLTSRRGCELLRRFCRKQPLKIVSSFLDYAEGTLDFDSEKNQLAANYLARHLPSDAWAVLVAELSAPNRSAMSMSRRRRTFLQLMRAAKNL